MRTIGETLHRHASRAPDALAMLAPQSRPLTYAGLLRHIDTLRSDLSRAGFSRSDRIALVLPSGPHSAIMIAAVSCSAIAIPLDPRLALPEVERRLTLLRPAAIVLPENAPSAARTLAEQGGLPIIEAGVPEPGTLAPRFTIPEVGAAVSPEEPDDEAPAVILQTSGTTGDPKLIPVSHRNMLACAERVQSWYALGRDDRCLSATPAYYAHGLIMTVLIPLLTSGSIAFPLDPLNLDVDQWFGELAPTWFSAGPTLHRYLLDKIKSMPDARTMRSLRLITSAGAPLPGRIGKGLQDALGVPVLEHYGASEAGQISTNLPAPHLARLGTCGIPSGDIVSVRAENGRQVAPGEIGEVWVRGPTVISGYIDAPNLNEAAFVDGWFRTGDLASLDEDGFLTLHGRKKELINRGGEKIAPAEIDDALMHHPAVVEAAAFAVAHPRLGEDVAAAVVLREGLTATPAELRNFLSGELAWFKIPRRILFRDHLPKGLTGKIQRQRLKEDCQ
jgi:acyl-CoA synthetase (AMP-forming)/AMP-acid ligase II